MNAEFKISGKVIQTKRLILRPFEQSDLQDFYEYAKVEGVGEMAGWRHHENVEKTQEILVEIDESFSLHDFRMVFGKNQTNVLFDVAVPYSCKLSKEEIKKIDERYCLVVTVEPCI